MVPTFIGYDFINEPSGSLLCRVLVPVDLLLFKSPLRKCFGMCPQRNFGRGMNKPKVTRFTLPWIALVGVNYVQVEECVIMTRMVVHIHGGEFLIGGH
jgi:hypothetical protein